MSAARSISSTKAKELIARATESTRKLTWLEQMRNSYAVIDRYCIRLIEQMREQVSWDEAAEQALIAMTELAETKIEILDNALDKHRVTHDRIMVELDNETD